MKKYKIFLLVAAGLVLSSCGKWLTINPEDQIKEEELYSKAEGFHTQINGVYRTMSSADLYGRELSYGIIEAVAQVYVVDSYSASEFDEYKKASNYDYKNERARIIIDKIWENTYNSITNCNSIIAYAEKADPNLFTYKDAERKCILGEAYALRAMLHFDIMRLYAPSLKSNSTGSFVPYQKSFPERIPVKTPQNEYIANVIADLELAHELTGYSDIGREVLIKELDRYLELYDAGTSGRFMVFRGYRLNHFAIKALLARVYLYAGNEEKALEYAQQVIALHTNSKMFKYNTTDEISKNFNSKMYSDVIFAGYNNQLLSYYLGINPVISAGSKADYLSLLDTDGIYKGDMNTDVRYKSLTKVVDEDRVSTKYLDNSSGSTDTAPLISQKLIPLIRMSEIYYIAAECIYNRDKAKAAEYLTYVRKKRGVTSVLAETANKSEFIQLVLNDVRREQVCEGQLFFFYKRLGLPVFKEGEEAIRLTEDKWSFPLPDSENIL